MNNFTDYAFLLHLLSLFLDSVSYSLVSSTSFLSPFPLSRSRSSLLYSISQPYLYSPILSPATATATAQPTPQCQPWLSMTDNRGLLHFDYAPIESGSCASPRLDPTSLATGGVPSRGPWRRFVTSKTQLHWTGRTAAGDSLHLSSFICRSSRLHASIHNRASSDTRMYFSCVNQNPVPFHPTSRSNR